MQPVAGQYRTIYRSRKSVDPAPSRAKYKLHRWALSPVFKFVVRVAIPVGVLGFLVWLFVMNDVAVNAIHEKVNEAQEKVAARPEYQLSVVNFTGASPELESEARDALGLTFPISRLDLNLSALEQSLRALPAVDDARVQLAPQGVLEVYVKEVPVAALWHYEDSFHAISANGAILRGVQDQSSFAAMPLIAGEGAPEKISEVMILLRELEPVAQDIHGFVRVGQRRWDVILTNDRRIALPEENALDALREVMVLAKSRDLLNKDISVIDFRVRHRPVVRLKPDAVNALEYARGLSSVGTIQ